MIESRNGMVLFITFALRFKEDLLSESFNVNLDNDRTDRQRNLFTGHH